MIDRLAERAEFEASPFQMLLVVLAYMIAASLFGLMALFPYSNWFVLAVGLVMFPFFCVFTMGWIRNAGLRGVVVSITSDGLLDRRLSDSRIPWSAVKSVTVHNNRPLSRGFPTLWIYLDPKFDAAWPKHFDAKLLSHIHRFAASPHGYLLAKAGLRASLSELEEAVKRHKFFFRWEPGWDYSR